MNDKLPIEIKEDNIFKKFLGFFKNIFKKQDEEIIIRESKDVSKTMLSFNENDLEEFKIKSIPKRNPQKVIEEIIQIIEKNPSALESLDIPKLEVIDAYYKHKIKECKRKLKKNDSE